MPRSSGFAYPPEVRVRRRREYQRVYRDGVRAPARHMVVFALPREDGPGGSRLGVTASRRVGGAVVRNRCKRRMRELFRLHRAALDGLDVDVVINARAGLERASWLDLRSEYVECVARVRRRLRGRETRTGEGEGPSR